MNCKKLQLFIKFTFIYPINLKWFELIQYFLTLKISTLPVILPPPLTLLPDRLHHLPPPVCLDVIHKTAMRYGKNTLSFVTVAVGFDRKRERGESGSEQLFSAASMGR